jgi:hypothetical protein
VGDYCVVQRGLGSGDGLRRIAEQALLAALAEHSGPPILRDIRRSNLTLV